MTLKIAAEFMNPLEAHIALGRLRVEGLNAHILHEHHVWANWMYAMALGGVKIAVPEGQLEQARLVLHDYHQGDFADMLENEDAITCPQCAIQQISYQNTFTQKVVILLTFGFLGWLIPLRKTILHCGSCQHCWRLSGGGS